MGTPRGRDVTAQQRHDFIAYLCRAHSWHKHLSLVDGGTFVVFLADDAGAGYDEAVPRLHHGWKTTEEYRRAYGFLDVQWRTAPDRPERRDGLGSVRRLDDEHRQRFGFVLFPYVSTDVNGPEAIGYARHQSDLARVRLDYARRDRALILAWNAALSEQEKTWQALDPDGRDRLSRLNDRPLTDAPNLHAVSPDVAAAYRADHRCQQIYHVLQQREESKIAAAVEALCRD